MDECAQGHDMAVTGPHRQRRPVVQTTGPPISEIFCAENSAGDKPLVKVRPVPGCPIVSVFFTHHPTAGSGKNWEIPGDFLKDTPGGLHVDPSEFFTLSRSLLLVAAVTRGDDRP